MQTPRITLTDLPTTWSEYQVYKSFLKTPCFAFITAIGDNENTKVITPDGKCHTRKRMLREDHTPILTAVLPTLITKTSHNDGLAGYQMPFESLFDESNHKYCVSSAWTLQETNQVRDFVEEIMLDATKCSRALRECDAELAMELLGGLERPMDAIIVRSICDQAAGLASRFLRALAVVRKQKMAYGDLAITCGMSVQFDGESYILHKFDDNYIYINNDGDKSIPF